MKNSTYEPIVVTHVISGDLWAGAEVQVYNLFKAFAYSKKILLSAVVFNEGILSQKLIQTGAAVTIADEKLFGPIRISKMISEHCKAHRTDIIHTHGFKENILGIIAKEISLTPFSVRTVHGNPEFVFSFRRPLKWLIHRLDMLLGKSRQHAVIAVSSQLETTLEKKFTGKVQKIHNFIDVADLQTQWSPKNRKIRGPLKIGIVGRLVQVKRLDIFLTMVSLLNNQGISCKGIIIGDGPLSENLKQMAERLSIQEKLEFKGFVDPATKEIKDLDILVMTSDHEGLPMTLLEALALGVPVVAHNVGGVVEILKAGECGWIVKDNLPRRYVEVIKQLINDKTETENKVTMGKLHVKAHFDLEISMEKYQTMYQKVAHRALDYKD
ncbi:glycosyltransferase family 4 protein [Marinobacter adhaerens]|uniref:glycosyltransferase family 4 protein n=1 Tax=Marinobacter adhaerens TaxID=1033846 RepID=UPI001C57F2B4|nr:glycosyltransferase family 4 protein [Marinobacter adhaerens]MBW3225625.1 glycosyltransferase family 4 protein [Marinobacter adhaerens]